MFISILNNLSLVSETKQKHKEPIRRLEATQQHEREAHSESPNTRFGDAAGSHRNIW
jgi:hypothetical protein